MTDQHDSNHGAQQPEYPATPPQAPSVPEPPETIEVPPAGAPDHVAPSQQPPQPPPSAATPPPLTPPPGAPAPSTPAANETVTWSAPPLGQEPPSYGALQHAPSGQGPGITTTDALQATLPQSAAPASSGGGSGRIAWIAAALGALVLIGGGAFFALRAAGDDGGAETPEAAITEMFAALSNEDFVEAATLIEPTERRTLIEPTFEILTELQRLGVLADSFDTASVDGIDLEYNDVEFRTTQVTEELFQVFIEGGETVSSFNAADLPLGDLVLDRVDDDFLSQSETERGLIEASDVPIAVVARDGRWYWSLWYTVGEGIRNQIDEPFPNGRQTLLPRGTETPDDVLEALMERAFDFDLEGVMALIDPEEGAALYDYSPLFLQDAQSVLDEGFAELRSQGFTWALTSIEVNADVDGDDAVLALDSMTANVNGSDTDLNLIIEPDRYQAQGTIEGEPVTGEISYDGECTTITASLGGEDINEQTCLSDGGLDEQQRELLDLFNGDLSVGLAARQVDGNWYMSPTSTMMNTVLSYLRAVDREQLELLLDLDVDDAVFDAADGGAGLFGGSNSDLDDFSPSTASVGTSIVVTVDSNGSGAVSGDLVSGTYDVIEFDLFDSSEVLVTLNSSDFDPFLVITDGGGFEIGSNDDFDGLNSGLVISGPGRFVAEARALGDVGGGAYELVISPNLDGGGAAVPPVDDPPDDSDSGAAAAGVVGALDTSGAQPIVVGNLGPDGPDQWELTIADASALRVSAFSEDFDGVLTLYDGEFIVDSNDDTNGRNPELLVQGPGSFIVELSSFNSGGTGPYTIEVGPLELGRTDRPVGVDQVLPWTGAELVVSGTLTPGNVDIHEIQLAQGETITINLSSPDGVIDPVVRVFDTAIVELGFNDDDGDGLDSALVFVAPTAGSFLIEAADLRNAGGSYELTVRPGDQLGG